MKLKPQNPDQKPKNRPKPRPPKTASQKMTAIKRRDILILLSIWLVGCALVMFLVGIFYSQRRVEAVLPPQPTAAPYMLAFEGKTAKEAYLEALTNAQSWQSDVQLVATSAFWPEATLSSLTRFENWDFRFFSPTRRRIYFAVTRPDQPVMGRPHLYKQDTTTSTPLIDPAAWLIDSDEAVTIWVNNGGGPFLEAFPGSSVELLLRQLPQQNTLVWDIISASPDQSQLFYLSINANDATILK